MRRVVGGSCERSTDYIVVRDGIDDESPVMATYCSSSSSSSSRRRGGGGDGGGVTELATITSSADTLSVELVSDEKKQRQGFAAQFTFIAFDSDDDRLSPLLPPSGGLVVDGATSSTTTRRPQFGGMRRFVSPVCSRRVELVRSIEKR